MNELPYVQTNRCRECRMRLELCLCAEIPKIEIKTRIAILMHSLEEHRTTNTVRLLKLAVPSTEILLFGRKGTSNELQIPPDVTPLVLYPEPSAPVLDADFCSKLTKPAMLIVPDGSWTQARKLIHRRENLYSIPRVRIFRDTPSGYKVRRGQTKDGLCTLEAIAEALGVLENAEVKIQLDRILKLMVDRVIMSRSSSRWLRN